jgi:hypothetical protein
MTYTNRVNYKKQVISNLKILNIKTSNKLILNDISNDIKHFLVLSGLEEYCIDRFNSWETMNLYLRMLIKIVDVAKDNTLLSEKFIEKNDRDKYNNVFFISHEAELIYYLTQLDGKVQMEKLKIEKKHYGDKSYAQKWRNKILQEIHPDKCKHNQASLAVEILNNIYKKMVN